MSEQPAAVGLPADHALICSSNCPFIIITGGTHELKKSERELASQPSHTGGICVEALHHIHCQCNRQQQSLDTSARVLYQELQQIYLRIVDRLSNITIVLGDHLTLAWKSWPVIMCCSTKSRINFASASFKPGIPVMNSPLTKIHFSPVTG